MANQLNEGFRARQARGSRRKRTGSARNARQPKADQTKDGHGEVRLPQNEYAALSLRDLLDARDQYHIHLMRHPNVVATAIGYYRVRNEDTPPGVTPIVKGEGPRTLANSAVRSYSWPAILVFVSEWIDPSEFAEGRTYSADKMVPKTLFLPDGRRVPVCVIEAPREAQRPSDPPDVRYPLNNIGGGWPVVVSVQGQEHVATIACLATDGHKTYALTNRHVSGDEGQVVSSWLGGRLEPIGVASAKQATRVAFSELYPGWPGRGTFVNVDVGLIDIADLDNWTAHVRGVGTIGPMVDLSAAEFSLALIGRQVTGHGAASQRMLGEIHGLFYRYKSRGGSEYVADFLIGPRVPRSNGAAMPPFATRPGDSGTLWLLEPLPSEAKTGNSDEERQLRPLAMQWGENRLHAGSGGEAQAYVLATCLSTICDRLDVDLVRDWNLDQPDTWGSVGHFSIANRVTVALSGDLPKLVKLMENNAGIVSHDDQTILSSEFKGMGEDAFIPMADVPDFFWKHGKQGHKRRFEGPNHFADMDQKRSSDGVDLLELCNNPRNIDPGRWNEFYDSVEDLLNGGAIERQHRGLLPFRVWQIFDAMVDFAAEGRGAEFVCAAGVLTHYVGDACQPLHISYLHDGDPLHASSHTVHHKNGTTSNKNVALGAGVHSAYEDAMVNANRKKILDGLHRTKKVRAAERIGSGFEAAVKTIDLMRATLTRVPPAKIVGAYVAHGKSKKGLPERLWQQFGSDTIACMQDGTHLLAMLWESAWVKGNGETHVKSMAALTEDAAMEICAPLDFLRSCAIDEIGALLKRNNGGS
jgi:hypothetical protein